MTTDTVIVRTGTASDIDAVLGVWSEAEAHPTMTDDAPSVAALVRRQPDALIVAVIGPRLVGTVIATWDGWRGNMYRLAVVPDLRRRRIAASLVEEAERRLRAAGCRRITALVAEVDDHAVDFWSGIGYEADALRRYVRTLEEPTTAGDEDRTGDGHPMVTWAQFEAGATALAALARERFEVPGLVLVGTLRRGGWPRISPVEPLIVDGQLYLGMMWQSKKALDLRGDPRCVVHSIVTGREGTEGDVKVYGRVVEISDPDERDRYGAALFERIGWRPQGPFHLFALDVEEVGYVRVEGEAHRVWHWRPGETLGALETHPGGAG